MVVQRSRRWVKDRIPAFICRETNWWVARWIQCNVLLCPECRKEYRSLKSVWDKLDAWEIEDPDGKTETCFVENFRQKFPGAYQEEVPVSKSTGFWIPRVAYMSVIALLGLAIYWGPLSRQPDSAQLAQVETSAAGPDSTNSKIEEQASVSTDLPSEVQIAEAPTTQAPALIEPDPPTQAQVVAVQQRVEALPPTLNLPPPGTRFRTTSTLEPVVNQQTLRTPLRMRTVEINDMPVSGFESLTQPYEEERPY